MEMVIVECPNCFGKIQLDKNVEKYFCVYCRKEIREKPKTRQEIELEILETKLDVIRKVERFYNSEQKTFGDVMKAYDTAKPFGEHISEYWLAYARFFTKGSLKELRRIELSIGRRRLSKYRVSLSDREKIINQYVELMDNCIKYADNKEMLEIEKEKTIDEIHLAFDEEEKRKSEVDEKDQELSRKIKKLNNRMHRKYRQWDWD